MGGNNVGGIYYYYFFDGVQKSSTLFLGILGVFPKKVNLNLSSHFVYII
jgi:hypothetical protein